MSLNDGTSAPPPTDARAWQHTTCVAHALGFADVRSRVRNGAVARRWRDASMHAAAWPGARLDLRGLAAPSAALRALLPPRAPRGAPAFRELRLEFAKDIGDDELALISGLERLHLNACQSVSAAGLAALAARNPALVELSLYWQPALDDAALGAFASACPGLRSLSISGCGRVTDAGARALAASACVAQLEALDLTRCAAVGDAGLRALCAAAAGARLARLNLYAAAKFRDGTYRKLGEALRGLVALDLTGARELGSASLGAIARGSGRTLAELNLTWCVGIDAAGGALLARHWRRPRLLSLHGLARVDGGALVALARHTAAAETLTTLDVRGCVGVPPEMRTREGLLELFPRLGTFVVHTG